MKVLRASYVASFALRFRPAIGLAAGCVVGAAALPASDGTWPMHNVERMETTAMLPSPWFGPKQQYRRDNYGPVGGFCRDIDGDGLPDFISTFEQGGVRIDFNPGPGQAASVWPFLEIPPAVTDSEGEGLAAGDLDGDGRIDIVLAMGINDTPEPDTDRRHAQGQLEILWGPEPGRARDAAGWSAVAILPDSVNAGDFNFVRVFDINGDGRPDVLAGPNSALPGTPPFKLGDYPYGGLQWYEAPAGDRRNVACWRRHQINGGYFGSSYGFERADIDGDGSLDIVAVDCDSRFGGTRPGDEKLVWFRNPGDGTAAQREPWPMRIIDRPTKDRLGLKPHLGVGDLNGDGTPDVALQSDDAIIVFLNRRHGDAWERVAIPKPEMIRWPGRSIVITDIDGDGRNDLMGALSRLNGRGRSIDPDRAAVFWMKCEDPRDVRADNWVVYPIKRGSGDLQRPPGSRHGNVGEKWNRFSFRDLNGDGTRDIIGNCEEYTSPVTDLSVLSVHWFEAPFAADRQAPQAPAYLRVERTAQGNRITWASARDNRGVAGYKIYRNGVFLAFVGNFNGETLTYLDSAGGDHRYAVAAYDAAANTSPLTEMEMPGAPPR